MFRFDLNTSKNFHLNLAFFISIWSVVFLVFIAPFDVENLTLFERTLKMPMYGFILFSSYLVATLVQDYIYTKKKKWALLYEFYIIMLFGALVLIASFLYYQSNIIGGGNNFRAYVIEIFLPIFLIISFVLVFLRLFYKRDSAKANNEQEVLFLRGENKFDILDLKAKNLICVFSAGNYVEVFYLIDNTLHKKLIRSTLKDIHYKIPYLKKVHRSRLINPEHFVRWKDNSTIILTQMEVGVSKNVFN